MSTLMVVLCVSIVILPTHSLPWNTLNETVQGRLLQGVPFARPCFQLANNTGGQFDPQMCLEIENGYRNHVARTAAFGSYINTQWETCQRTGLGCLLDADAPDDPTAYTPPRTCSQGSIPEFAINVTNASDVLAGFDFAKTHQIPLVIRNTGHDYKGRSAAPGSLALWMHNLKAIELENAFVAQGCPLSTAKKAVTIGAGVQYIDLVDFADANNITIPSGGDLSVGAAGGFSQGGGHGILSPAYGLAADRVLQYEVVTPRGDHVFVNECQWSDLFFALRGGGGGTFGVVLKMTTLALPSTPITTVLATIDPTRENQGKLIQLSTDTALALATEGWGAYIIPAFGAILANPLLDMETARVSLANFSETITGQLNGTFSLSVQPNYKTFFNNFIGALVHVPIGEPLTVASRLIPAANFKDAGKRTILANVINSTYDQVDITIMFATTPFFYGQNPKASVTPAWRSSLWHVALGNVWNFNTTTAEIVGKYAALSSAGAALRSITPGSGAYQNEANLYEPDHEESFWGSNYPRLLAIKQKYDPNHILDCWHCVGWKGTNDSRYQCYIQKSWA